MWNFSSRLVLFALTLCTLLTSLIACGNSASTSANGIQEANGKPIDDANTAVAYLLALRLVRYNMKTIGKEPVTYTKGRLTSVGSTRITYDDEGRIAKFGDKAISYNEGLISSIGTTKITYDTTYPQHVSKIGNERVTYNDQDLAISVGPSKLSYDDKRRATKVGNVPIVYKSNK